MEPERGSVRENREGRFLLFQAAAIGITCVVPAAIVGTDFPAGLAALFQQSNTSLNLAREIGVGLLVAGLATAGAVGAIRFVPHWNASASGPVRSLGAAFSAASLPGLFGSLLLSLLVLALLRSTGTSVLGRTVVPWLVAQGLFLVPRGLCLDYLVRNSIDGRAVHAARLLANSGHRVVRRAGARLIWSLCGAKQLAAFWLLWYSAYFDLATGQLLAPAGMSSAPVTLYIQMHYGRNAVLSAMTLVTVLAPVGVAGLILVGQLARYRGWLR